MKREKLPNSVLKTSPPILLLVTMVGICQEIELLNAVQVALEKPLLPVVCSWLRELASLCSIVRATLKSSQEEVWTDLNLLICMVNGYYKQSDLVDHSFFKI